MPSDQVTGRFVPIAEDRDYRTYTGLRRKDKIHLLCDRWRESYANFQIDMGPRPDLKMVLGRVEINEPYCKGNCKWMTRRDANMYQLESKRKSNGEEKR